MSDHSALYRSRGKTKQNDNKTAPHEPVSFDNVVRLKIITAQSTDVFFKVFLMGTKIQKTIIIIWD